VQIGVAHAAGTNIYKQAPLGQRRAGNVGQFQRIALDGRWLAQQLSFHLGSVLTQAPLNPEYPSQAGNWRVRFGTLEYAP
jgi:hypothetical protein